MIVHPWETFVRQKSTPSLLVDVDGRRSRREVPVIALDDRFWLAPVHVDRSDHVDLLRVGAVSSSATNWGIWSAVRAVDR